MNIRTQAIAEARADRHEDLDTEGRRVITRDEALDNAGIAYAKALQALTEKRACDAARKALADDAERQNPQAA